MTIDGSSLNIGFSGGTGASGAGGGGGYDAQIKRLEEKKKELFQELADLPASGKSQEEMEAESQRIQAEISGIDMRIANIRKRQADEAAKQAEARQQSQPQAKEAKKEEEAKSASTIRRFDEKDTFTRTDESGEEKTVAWSLPDEWKKRNAPRLVDLYA